MRGARIYARNNKELFCVAPLTPTLSHKGRGSHNAMMKELNFQMRFPCPFRGGETRCVVPSPWKGRVREGINDAQENRVRLNLIAKRSSLNPGCFNGL